MQDRFKFRVWFEPDYQKPEMIYEAEHTYDNRCRNKGSFHHESFGEILEDKNCIIMQCTGLKDMNGNLIYESDIIAHTKTNYTQRYVVNWNNKGFWQLDDNAMARSVKFLEENYEIIGNIYENEELLESESE